VGGVKGECEVDWVAAPVLWEHKIARYIMRLLRKVRLKKKIRQ
jgi:hypothetical protein